MTYKQSLFPKMPLGSVHGRHKVTVFNQKSLNTEEHKTTQGNTQCCRAQKHCGALVHWTRHSCVSQGWKRHLHLFTSQKSRIKAQGV